ncbi:Bax inhibitor-1/YccA family protein [Flavobacterium branchiophilum]|uniref:Permease n=1 Tax=Flavobacterium branchiophilum TaxID=55197 RepID=A0A2H3KD06_9FLAO|nr:Bax inhibitor-1 family protein [Flavobacterium branchiophilum]PDS25457.1 permease [Flavobacterium branchiophilum]
MYTQNILVAHASSTEQATFYKKTYLHVALAVLSFIIVESFLLKVVPESIVISMISSRFLWLFLIGIFWLGSVLTTNMTMAASRDKQYLGLGLYVFLEGFLFLPLITVAIQMTGGDVIMQAALITLFMFLGLTAVVFLTKADFSFLRTALVIGGFLSIGIVIVGALFGFNLGLWFSVFMVVLASGSILYQTNQIKNQYGTAQYVGAALQLFASVMMLFWYILRILMSRRN